MLGVGFVLMVAVAFYTSSSTLEIVATTTGLLSVWMTAREHIWAWPIGLVNVGCFFFMFWEAKLYADMTLQVFFFVLSLYGWVIWLTNREGAKVLQPEPLLGVSLLFLDCFLSRSRCFGAMC